MLKNTHTTHDFLNKNLDPKDFFYVVTFPKDALAIESIFPYNIVCFDDHPIIDFLQKKDINIFSLDRNTNESPKRRSTAVLLKNPYTIKWINSISDNPKIIVFKPSPSLEKICAQNNWMLIANPAKLNREIENKINFTKIIDNLNLPQPKFVVKKLHQTKYINLISKLGKNFFLQFPRGFAGSSTFEIKSEKDLKNIQNEYLNYPTKFSQKIIGPTYTLNACVTQTNGIIIQKPFYQITNIPRLNSSPGGTCGNIYSTNYCQPTNKILGSWNQNLEKIESKSFLNNTDKINQINYPIFNDTKIFGEYLQKNNYLGIFGLDFVIDKDNGNHYFIECNPRLTASIPMISKLQITNNEIPLFALHILELTSQSYNLEQNAIKIIQSNPSLGSQIIFRNIKTEPTKTPLFYPSGVYLSNKKFNSIFELEQLVFNQNSGIKFIRKGTNILDLKNKDEFLILCEPKNKSISPDIEYLRIQSLI